MIKKRYTGGWDNWQHTEHYNWTYEAICIFERYHNDPQHSGDLEIILYKNNNIHMRGALELDTVKVPFRVHLEYVRVISGSMRLVYYPDTAIQCKSQYKNYIGEWVDEWMGYHPKWSHTTAWHSQFYKGPGR